MFLDVDLLSLLVDCSLFEESVLRQCESDRIIDDDELCTALYPLRIK